MEFTLLKDRKIIAYGFLVVLIIGVLFMTDRYRSRLIKDIQKDKEEKASYTYFIEQNQSNRGAYNPNDPRPLERHEVEQYQNNLIRRMTEAKIDVSAMNMVNTTAQKVTDGVEFEVTASGSWNEVLNYLNSLRTEPVLITIRSLHIEPGQNNVNVKTNFKYKFYLIN